jgi:hypothetical protein
MPGSSAENRNKPDVFVVWVRIFPVLACVRLMVAPGTAALELSSTVPVSALVPVCAGALKSPTNKNRAIAAKHGSIDRCKRLFRDIVLSVI